MKSVFVLGAGFSNAGGIPVLKDFFKEVGKRKSEVGSSEESERFNYVLEIKEHMEGKRYKEINMESAFIYVDNEYNNKKEGKLDGFNITTEELRRHFLYVICKTFHLCWTNNGRSKIYHDIEIKDLYRNYIFKLLQAKTTIITFNYDLIIDNLLMMNEIIPDYAVGRDMEYLNKGDLEKNGYNLELSKDLKYLKLHGSLNWFVCRNCGRKYIKLDVEDNCSTDGKDYSAFSGEKCSKCKKRMDFVIIPPTDNKTTPKEPDFLKSIWKEAEVELRNASEMTFIGYSFPCTDKNIKKWFKDNIINNNKLKRIRVINKTVEEKLSSKYEDVFGDICKRRIEYYSTTFEDWMVKALGD